jgi:hypothetical protein
MSKFDGDVRPLSNNPAYMGVVFEGTIDEAIAQAKAAPDHGVAEQYVPEGMSRDRAALLQHLNLLEHFDASSVAMRRVALLVEESDDRVRAMALEAKLDAPVDSTEPAAGTSRYSVEYAQQRGWIPKNPEVVLTLEERFNRLNSRQMDVYWAARVLGNQTIRQAVLTAEYYPYPVPR